MPSASRPFVWRKQEVASGCAAGAISVEVCARHKVIGYFVLSADSGAPAVATHTPLSKLWPDSKLWPGVQSAQPPTFTSGEKSWIAISFMS